MSNIDQQISQLKAEVEVAERARARAENEKELARLRAESAKVQLSKEFNVTSVAEAKALAASMESELQEIAKKLQQSLARLK